MSVPQFRRQVMEARSEAVESLRGRVVGGGPTAISTLVEVAERRP
jgi:hypothetical protein